jgi:hypothetical protein
MAGEGEVRGLTETANSTLKLIIEILRMLRADKVRQPLNKSSKELDLKPGAVEYNKLKAATDKKGESLSAQDRIPEKYLQQIRDSAKKYGMPIAVVGGKDTNGNYTMAFRSKDRELFQHIMSDIVKKELAARPGEFTRIPLKEWEVIPMQTEIDMNGINASIVQDDNGVYYCVFQEDDKAKFDVINKNFTKSHTEVVEKFGFKHTDDSFVLQDKSTGKQITLSKEGSYSANDISDKLMKEFGYERTKATIAAWSFANSLDTERQQDFFEVNALSEIHLENENLLVANYEFYRVNMKEDGIDQFMIMDSNGKIANLSADNSMNIEILNNMGITDKMTVDALLEKNTALHDIFNNRAKELHEIELSNSKLEINRIDKDSFEIRSVDDVQSFSFSDKQKSVDEMATFINGTTNAGFIESRVIAKQAFENAQQQSFHQSVAEVEKSSLPQYEINREVGGTFIVKFGDIENQYKLDNKENAISGIKEDFGLTDEKAEIIFEKAQEQNAIEGEVEIQLFNEQEIEMNMPDIPPTPDIPPPEFPHEDIDL